MTDSARIESRDRVQEAPKVGEAKRANLLNFHLK